MERSMVKVAMLSMISRNWSDLGNATGLRLSVDSWLIQELPILEAVIRLGLRHRYPPSFLLVPVNSIKNRLTALKKDWDHGDFSKSSDVNSQYQAVIKQGPWPHLIPRISIINFRTTPIFNSNKTERCPRRWHRLQQSLGYPSSWCFQPSFLSLFDDQRDEGSPSHILSAG